MKDVSEGLRLSVYNAINGNLSWDAANVPVYDEEAEINDTLYVILSTQTETPTDRNDSAWITKASILLDVHQLTWKKISKDATDRITGQIMQIILPTTITLGITAPVGFQYANLERSDARSLPLRFSSNNSISRKLLTLTLDIIQT